MYLNLIIAALAASPTQQTDDHDRERRPFPPLEEARTIDGRDNHLIERRRGATFTPLARELSTDYADGVTAPAGSERPGPRFVSNGAVAQDASRPNARGVSDLFWQWGQFLDHDVTETPVHAPAEHFPIRVPLGDPWFDPTGAGGVELPFQRSFPVRVGGVREQINAITAWIDGSQIYGSDSERAAALRTLDGTGRLKTSPGQLLPFNVDGLPNAPSDALAHFFLAGDVRANEQVGLTALHVLFVREHNSWAEHIATEDRRWVQRQLARHAGDGSRGHGGHGGGRALSQDDFESTRARALSGDEIYELARAIVSAELQLVTYREWLPLLLGPGALPPGFEYRPDLDASIRNEFATAAFRLGHSMLSPSLARLDQRGRSIPEGPLSLAEAFFAPRVLSATGIDPILRGLASQRAQELDIFVIDEVRNFLFGAPGAGGLDLPALNLQRGRDHGLPSYAQARRDLGLGAPSSFAEMTSDPEVAERLAQVARTPEGLDLWLGGLAEDPLPGALVGPTFHGILLRQFQALRDGDRLWHSRQLPAPLIERVQRESLASIMRRNSGLDGELSQTPFLAP